MSHSSPSLSSLAFWISPFLFLSYLVFLALFPFLEKESYYRLAVALFMWESFLFVILIPLGLSLPGRWDGVYLFFLNLLGTSLFLIFLLPQEAGKIGAFQFSLFGFALFLFSSHLLFSTFLPSLLPQLFSTLFGLFLLSSLLLSNWFLSLGEDKAGIIQILLSINPIPSGIYALCQWDFFRLSWMYDFSHVSDYPYSYPSPWKIGENYLWISALLLALYGVIYRLKKWQQKKRESL